MTATTPPQSRIRRWYGVAAAVALAVTILFATVGDGVNVPEATGLRQVIVEFGHTLVWALLALAFIIATLRGRWSKPSQSIAMAAGICYGIFLITVFLWP